MASNELRWPGDPTLRVVRSRRMQGLPSTNSVPIRGGGRRYGLLLTPIGRKFAPSLYCLDRSAPHRKPLNPDPLFSERRATPPSPSGEMVGSSPTERANHQLYLIEPAEALDVPKPQQRGSSYEFEIDSLRPPSADGVALERRSAPRWSSALSHPRLEFEGFLLQSTELRILGERRCLDASTA